MEFAEYVSAMVAGVDRRENLPSPQRQNSDENWRNRQVRDTDR
jgi:hypothetical protein